MLFQLIAQVKEIPGIDVSSICFKAVSTNAILSSESAPKEFYDFQGFVDWAWKTTQKPGEKRYGAMTVMMVTNLKFGAVKNGVRKWLKARNV